MKLPSESLPLPAPEQQSPPAALRKLSLLHQSGLDWQQSLQLTDLKKLGNYISSNIQSQRKNILQLYSSSFYTLHKNEHTLPELNLNVTSRTLKKKGNRDPAELASPCKPSLTQELNDRDFIVSNNFPNKLLKNTEKIRIEPPVRAASPQRIRQKKEVVSTPPPLRNIESKMERTIPVATREIRRKLPKLLKSRSNEQEQNELNPWEYLKIQDQPIFNIFI